MRKFAVALLPFCLLSPSLASQEPVITLEEVQLMLTLTGNSLDLISGSIKHVTELSKSNVTLIESSQNSMDILEPSKKITDNSAETLTYLSITTEGIGQSSEDLGSISTDLNLITESLSETSKNLKPSFWESRLGKGIKWTGVIALSVAAGYGVGRLHQWAKDR